jgi:hypothetical protein
MARSSSARDNCSNNHKNAKERHNARNNANNERQILTIGEKFILRTARHGVISRG